MGQLDIQKVLKRTNKYLSVKELAKRTSNGGKSTSEAVRKMYKNGDLRRIFVEGCPLPVPNYQLR